MFSQACFIPSVYWGGECMVVGNIWQEVCMAKGGMCGGGGACVAGETATEADDTHPIAMNSC